MSNDLTMEIAVAKGKFRGLSPPKVALNIECLDDSRAAADLDAKQANPA